MLTVLIAGRLVKDPQTRATRTRSFVFRRDAWSFQRNKLILVSGTGTTR
jgi:hypothetical protein